MYDELKTWQAGIGACIGAVIGLISLLIAANRNFNLNRRRDEALRQDETRSIAAALYGEMRLMRDRAAKTGLAVARLYVKRGVNERYPVKFDKHFVAQWSMPEPAIYRALASKLGLLPSQFVLLLAAFYDNAGAIHAWLPRLADDPERGYLYGANVVLDPVVKVAEESLRVLRLLEEILSIPDYEAVKELDISEVHNVIEMENPKAEAVLADDR